MPGPVDADRIPDRAVSGAFALSGVTLELRDLAAQAGGGTVAGSGTVNIDNFENRWKLVVTGLDLKRLHGSLIATSLAGRIEADVNDKRATSRRRRRRRRTSSSRSHARYDGTTSDRRPLSRAGA